MNKNYILITGASSGIGKSLAYIFAQNNFSLILVARRKHLLDQIAEDLQKTYGISVHALSVDLKEKDSIEQLLNTIEANQWPIETLINNAGCGYCDWFIDTPIDKDEAIIHLNILAPLRLTKGLLHQPSSILKKILNVGSIGGFQGGPKVNTYYASKAFMLSFSEALGRELKEQKIQVSLLAPGPTLTEFSQLAGKKEHPLAWSSEKTALYTYRAFLKGKEIIIPGFPNKLWVFATRFLPRKLSTYLVGKNQKK